MLAGEKIGYAVTSKLSTNFAVPIYFSLQNLAENLYFLKNSFFNAIILNSAQCCSNKNCL